MTITNKTMYPLWVANDDSLELSAGIQTRHTEVERWVDRDEPRCGTGLIARRLAPNASSSFDVYLRTELLGEEGRVLVGYRPDMTGEEWRWAANDPKVLNVPPPATKLH